MKTSVEDVARWMLDVISRDEFLYQDDAVYTIADLYGDRFVYENANGNLAISKEVLAAFRKLSEQNIVWVRGERMWRLREESDTPGRMQV